MENSIDGEIHEIGPTIDAYGLIEHCTGEKWRTKRGA
jgi:hypothetical protein